MNREKKGPGVSSAQALPMNIKLAGFDVTEDSPSTLNLQARRIRETFAVSWPVARVAAELAFASYRGHA